jgi:hypothetical protein
VIASLGGIAALIIVLVAVVPVLLLGVAFLSLFRVLEATRMAIDDLRKETVPLLHEVTGTVSGVNKELERVDGMVESAGKIVKSAERISTVVESAVSSPLIKVAAFGAGASRAVRRLRKKKE